MRKIDVAELVPGMVVAENIISFSNQLIYPAGYRLTDKAITKLTFYSVPFVCVEDESDHFIQNVFAVLLSSGILQKNLKRMFINLRIFLMT